MLIQNDLSAVCEGGKESEACSADDPCSAGSHFCDVDDSDDNNNDSVEVNTCKACPDDLTDCFIDGFASSHQAKINCHDCRMNCYNAMGRATITILSSNETTFAGYADEYLIQYSHQDVTGPLVDCSNLLVQKFVQKMTSRLKWRDGIPRVYVRHVLRWRMDNPIPPVVSFQRMIILIGITIWTLSRVVPLRVMLLSVSSLFVLFVVLCLL